MPPLNEPQSQIELAKTVPYGSAGYSELLRRGYSAEDLAPAPSSNGGLPSNISSIFGSEMGSNINTFLQGFLKQPEAKNPFIELQTAEQSRLNAAQSKIREQFGRAREDEKEFTQNQVAGRKSMLGRSLGQASSTAGLGFIHKEMVLDIFSILHLETKRAIFLLAVLALFFIISPIKWLSVRFTDNNTLFSHLSVRFADILLPTSI